MKIKFNPIKSFKAIRSLIKRTKSKLEFVKQFKPNDLLFALVPTLYFYTDEDYSFRERAFGLFWLVFRLQLTFTIEKKV